MLNKEVKQNKALLAILGKSGVKENTVVKKEVEVKKDAVVEQQGKQEGAPGEPATEQATSKKKRNERSYERFRGKADDGKTPTKPMSYYISQDHISAILARVEQGLEKDKSEVVRAAIERHCKTQLQEIRKNKKQNS